MGFVAAGTAVATSLYGANEAKKASKKQAHAQTEAANFEAAQMEQNAAETQAVGTFNAKRIAEKRDAILASQRAAAAAAGSAGDISTQEVAADTVRQATVDQLVTMWDADSQAKKDRAAAKMTRKTGQSMADATRRQGNAAFIQGVGSSLLSASGFNWQQAYGQSMFAPKA